MSMRGAMQRRFPRHVQALAEVFDFAARFCAAEQIDDRDRWVVDLTLEELFTNVLKHNPEGRGEVLIELERTDGQVALITMCAGGGMAPAIVIERV